MSDIFGTIRKMKILLHEKVCHHATEKPQNCLKSKFGASKSKTNSGGEACSQTILVVASFRTQL